jgi:hypothetical protein
MSHKKAIAGILILIIVISIVAFEFKDLQSLLGHNSLTVNSTPSPAPSVKTASDYAQSTFTLSIDNIDLINREGQPSIRVKYSIFADGKPFDLDLIPDPNVIIDRLDWSHFSISVNGKQVTFSRDETSPFIYWNLSLSTNTGSPSTLNVIVKYRDSQLTNQIICTSSNHLMGEILSWNATARSNEFMSGSAYSSMHKVFDQYATVISGFVFFRDHIFQLKCRFTSLDNWYPWLTEAVQGSTSFDTAWASFQVYANATGMEDLFKKTWNEINAFVKAIPQFQAIFTDYQPSVLKAIKTVAISHLTITSLSDNLNLLESSSSGSSIEKTISSSTQVLQQIYVQLASDFFSWVQTTSPYSDQQFVAKTAKFYMDNFQTISTVAGFDGLMYHTISDEYGPIIDTNEQMKYVGGSGVAWYPAVYSIIDIFGDFVNYMPFRLDDAPTSFPLSEISFTQVFGGRHYEFQVYLATESIVQKYLTTNGFAVSNLPPTENEKVNYDKERMISRFFVSEVAGSTFIQNQILLQDINKLSNAYRDFESISDSLGIIRKYGSSENLLDELNANTFQVVLK